MRTTSRRSRDSPWHNRWRKRRSYSGPWRTSIRGRARRDKCQPWARENNWFTPARGPTNTTGICARIRRLARNWPFSTRNLPGKVKFFMTIYSMNKQGKLHKYRNCWPKPSCVRTITIGQYSMDTTTISCTKKVTDIHKRGVLERIVEPPL